MLNENDKKMTLAKKIENFKTQKITTAEEYTKSFFSIVKDPRFVKIAAKAAKESGMITAKEWNENRAMCVTLMAKTILLN